MSDETRDGVQGAIGLQCKGAIGIPAEAQALLGLAGELAVIRQVIAPKPILVITRDGQFLRHGVLIEELSKDELLILVRELVGLVRNG